jgi:ketosteroid isomerase-like protein
MQGLAMTPTARDRDAGVRRAEVVAALSHATDLAIGQPEEYALKSCVLGKAHEIHTFEPVRFLSAEDEVFIWGHYRWTMRQSGVSKDTEWLHVITLRDGKMTRWRGHNDTAMLAEAYHGSAVDRRAVTA